MSPRTPEGTELLRGGGIIVVRRETAVVVCVLIGSDAFAEPHTHRVVTGKGVAVLPVC